MHIIRKYYERRGGNASVDHQITFVKLIGYKVYALDPAYWVIKFRNIDPIKK